MNVNFFQIKESTMGMPFRHSPGFTDFQDFPHPIRLLTPLMEKAEYACGILHDITGKSKFVFSLPTHKPSPYQGTSKGNA